MFSGTTQYLRNRRHDNYCSMFLSSYRNMSESLGEREMLWEHEPTCECFHSCFVLSQTSILVSITR